jgi:hypothetical protein
MIERALTGPLLMRKLKFARRRSPSEETEAAEALQWLGNQPVSVGYAADSLPVFRYLVAVARQYERSGLSLQEMVEVGYLAGLQGQALWNWRARVGMLKKQSTP